MGAELLVLASIAVAIVAPILTYLLGIRNLSGKITHTAAEELWQESRSIREFLEARNQFLTEKIDRLEEEVRALQEENRKLHRENGALLRVITSHEQTIEDQRRRISALEAERELLTQRVAELEGNHVR